LSSRKNGIFVEKTGYLKEKRNLPEERREAEGSADSEEFFGRFPAVK
jgi:hypothetical protein